ncbi:hypothetical protein NLJ89_g6573 [Agrocybe chaxingu]|uniref:C3H1-type domain-containing protein n=1 Tax=Agrocybe chaxingu TaxID=84603 RepID=A0A9W8JYX8_9AGAR|nr:hypothetical protein NLJ89_g6573 [Agrocybe chaxingu]
MPPSQAAVEARRAQRAVKKAKREGDGDALRLKGNELFKSGDYIDTARCYVRAIYIQGPRPVLMSNLAAVYLKLEEDDAAEWAATTALEYDPKMTKARFRRGMARKGMMKYEGAEKDFDTIIRHDPNCREAHEELRLMRSFLASGDRFNRDSDEDDTHPLYDDEPWPYSSESDSPDCARTGSGKGFSYNRSVRDELGRNVCVNFLMGNCKFGDKCVYSHDKTYLPAQGWWNYPDQVRAAQKVKEIIQKEETFDEVNKALRDNPRARKYGARRHRKEILSLLEFHQLGVLATAKEAKQKRVSSDRFVLLLSMEEEFFGNIHTHLLNALKQKIRYIQATTTQQATQYLESAGLAAVFATDAALSKRKNSALLDKIVQYVKDGGAFVAGGSFSSFVRPPDFPVFTKAFGLDWTYGSYHRTTFALNPANEIVKRNPSLVPAYSMKALHAGNIQREHALYGPTDESRIQSMVFAPTRITDHSEAPAVCAHVGRGLFSFLGDVNGENGSTNTILAMLGLLDNPNPPLPDPKQPSVSTSRNSNPRPSPQDSNGHSSDTKAGPSKQEQKQKEQPKKVSTPEPQQKQNQSAAPAANGAGANFVKLDKCIVVLALQDATMLEWTNADQLFALRERVAEVKIPKTTEQALTSLASSNLGGVFIADKGISGLSNKLVLTKVVDWVKNGGQAAIGGLFPKTTTPEQAGDVFAAFGLVKWKTGSNCRAEAELNRHHETAVKNEETLVESFDMTAVHVTGFLPSDMLYEQYFQEYEYDSDFEPPGGEAWEAPVLQTHVGNGQLGYIGDVNAEHESTKVLLAMLDLLALPKALVPDSQKFIIVLSWFSKPAIETFDKEFMADVKSKVEVLFGLSNARVAELLKSSDLAGVLLTDADIMAPSNAYLLSKLVEYSKNGGTLVFARFFSHRASTTQFRPFFQKNWGLEWDLCPSREDAVVAKNSKNDLIQADKESKLSNSFRLEGTYVDGIRQEMAVYSAQNRADLWKPKEEVVKSAVVYAQVEQGHLGYIGVNNLDGDFRSIFFAMLGLL